MKKKYLIFFLLLLSSIAYSQNSAIEILDVKATPYLELKQGEGNPATRVLVEATLNSVAGLKKIYLYVGTEREVYNLFKTTYRVAESMGKKYVISLDNKKIEIMNNSLIRFDFGLDENRFSNYKSIKIIVEDAAGNLSQPAYFDHL